MSKEAKILIGIAGAVLVIGALLAIFANPQPKDPGQVADQNALVRSNNYMTGSLDAKVTLVEFGDFQCPACAAALPNVTLVKEQFKDNPDFNFVFRHFPLDSIHPNARVSANAAEAAGAQGKFFEMHDLLFQRQELWSAMPDPTDAFVELAKELGLDEGQFRSDVENRIYNDIITADYNDGVTVGVNATPTFYLNGQKLDGFNPNEVVEQINQLLSEEDGAAEESAEAMSAEPGTEEAMMSEEQPEPEAEPAQ